MFGKHINTKQEEKEDTLLKMRKKNETREMEKKISVQKKKIVKNITSPCKRVKILRYEAWRR